MKKIDFIRYFCKRCMNNSYLCTKGNYKCNNCSGG
jgi:hypothetical protein